MDKLINSSQIIDRLDENGLKYQILNLQDNAYAIIIERGGHIFGPFIRKNGESLFWMNPVFADKDKFVQFLSENNWNTGGDRNWIAPEIQFITMDRADPHKVSIPPQMDPGEYLFEDSHSNEIKLKVDMTLEARNVAKGMKELHLETAIRPVNDPLRFLSNYALLIKDTQFIGYEQQVSLAEINNDGILCELWNLVQLNSGGDIIIPTYSEFELTNYVQPPIDPYHFNYQKDHLKLKISGKYMYKVGLKSAQFSGRIAYINFNNPNQSYLIVRNYFNNPSSLYVEEPAWNVGYRGDSVHIYNDGGKWGGFGEMEVHGQTIGGKTGKSFSTDLLQMWIYVGEPDKLKIIGRQLLGIRFS